jgi:hypothetical protein
MRENGLLAPHRVGRTAAKPHDGTITTDKVNEMWGTDMTLTITIPEGRVTASATCCASRAARQVFGGDPVLGIGLSPSTLCTAPGSLDTSLI